MPELHVSRESAAVILVTPSMEVIVHLRDDKPEIASPNCLALFGGRLEPGELPVEAAFRELEEETTLIPDKLTPFLTFPYVYEPLGIMAAGHVFVAYDVNHNDIDVREGQGYRLISSEKDLDGVDGYRFSKPAAHVLRLFFRSEYFINPEKTRALLAA